MACTLWFHFNRHDEEIRAKQNYDWLIRFQDKEKAIHFAHEMFLLCQIKLELISGAVVGQNESEFPDEVARLIYKKNSLGYSYRYWHDDMLEPLVCLWDHAEFCRGLLNGSLNFEMEEGYFNLGSIRSETMSFDLYLGDEFFVPPPYYYDKLCYVSPVDANNMLDTYPLAGGIPENYFSRSYSDREEPYDFTRPEPLVADLDKQLQEYMQV